MTDPYTVLGVSKDVSHDDLRKAYRKLAKQYHPDLNPGNAEAERKFKDISAAYDILGDADKRKRFDSGEIDEQGAEKPERSYYRQYAESDAAHKYSGASARQGAGPDGFDDFDDTFSGLFGRRGNFKMPGADVHYTLRVPFLEAINGTRKSVVMPNGKRLDIKIPPGLRDGQSLRLKGQGGEGLGGDPPGDALIEVTVEPHPTFTRDGNDIRSVLPVTIGEALNSASVRAETVSGPVNVKIPKGANSGTTMRLRGKGVSNESGAGDHLVELRVVLPRHADDELARLIGEWELKHPYNPRDSR